ncbi:MAG: hypothetical protein K9K76_11375 [Halanaerobiales bacterium]|nr:hypothetical protein [Halanaerobiales bacterium]
MARSNDGATAELEGVEETLKATAEFVEKEERAIEDALEFILKSMVNYAKNNGPWQDHTSNLRNSISGNIEEMKEWDADTDPSTLAAKAPELEKPVIEINGDDYKAVLSAGMEYAIWVELKSGYWVLQGTIDKFEPLIDKYFKGYLSVEKIDLENAASIAYMKQVG